MTDSGAYRRLVRWQLARDIASWSIPAAIVGAIIVLLFHLTGEAFR